MMLVLLFLPLFTYATVIEINPMGAGHEMLMSGTGQAYLGSEGTLISNPALLAWLPQEKKFITTNTLSFYKIKSDRGENLNINPDIIPRYAATTEGLGDWGYGYGLNVEQVKAVYASEFEQTQSEGISENSRIALLAGVGKKFKNNQSMGLTILVMRSMDSSRTNFYGQSGGTDFIGSSERKESFWGTGIALGWIKKFETWTLGASSRMNFIRFGADATTKQVAYFEATQEFSMEKSESLGPMKSVPNLSLGFKKDLEKFKILLDCHFSPSYHDPLSNHKKSPLAVPSLGLELPLKLESYTAYGGLALTPGSGGEDKSPSYGQLSAGLSKKNKYSSAFGGLSLARNVEVADNQIVSIIFGTKFSY